jgi:putative addiction module component (TIGR02574 family)
MIVAMDPKRVFEDALQLPPEARAALAAELIATLDEEADPDAEAAWSEEIRRRLDEVDRGAVRPIPWSEARRRILAASGRGSRP